jgi:two-component system sensor histidine kinase DegS
MDEMVSTSELTLQGFVDATHRSFEHTEKELSEIEVLVKQSTAEVERLTQHSARVGNYVSHLQTNFDTIPREDIKEGYEALINAQQRLFTMRGQLEKLQSDLRNLERLAQFQRRVLALTDGISDVPGRRAGRNDKATIIRVIQTEESARQSLVRRMHDGPASSLSNFILQAEICQRYFDVDPVRARVELEALKKSAATTFSTVKSFIFDLRPMMLDDLGVVPTLRRYLESVEEKYEIKVSMTVTGIARRLPEHVEVTIFRAAQELVNNARVHGRADKIEVLLDMDERRVLVVVEDNGSGFRVDDVFGHGQVRGTVGLPTIRDRVEMLGGELAIDSDPDMGTRAEIVIPAELETGELVT